MEIPATISERDTQIAVTFRMLGWLGVLAIVAWFFWRSCQKCECTNDL